MSFRGMRCAVLTVSDSCAKGECRDQSGVILKSLLKKRGAVLLSEAVCPDQKRGIKKNLSFFCDKLSCDLVLTTGGTGLSPRDVTPEATRAVLDKEAAGIVELMRSVSFLKTRRAALSRAVAGTRGKSLIINLPGSPRAVRESFEAVAEIIPHALSMMKGGGHGRRFSP
jgi:molybdopterin adenylyltransferase